MNHKNRTETRPVSAPVEAAVEPAVAAAVEEVAVVEPAADAVKAKHVEPLAPSANDFRNWVNILHHHGLLGDGEAVALKAKIDARQALP